jgi:Zn-dependent peptidase ImmA (M78 family)
MARRVLRERNITAPPVPVRGLARLEGLEVLEVETLGSLSARLIDNRIELVAREPEVRKRFSIAHELGHHFLGTTHGSGPTVEREADAFAGELLVPGHLLRWAVDQSARVDDLRQRFQVSRQVIEIAAQTHRFGDRLS